jgi:hypothetical protein
MASANSAPLSATSAASSAVHSNFRHHRRNLVGAQPGSRGRLRGQRGRLTVGRVGVAARGGRSEKCKGDTPLLTPTRPVILPGDEGEPILCRAPKAAEAIAELITMLIGRTASMTAALASAIESAIDSGLAVATRLYRADVRCLTPPDGRQAMPSDG